MLVIGQYILNCILILVSNIVTGIHMKLATNRPVDVTDSVNIHKLIFNYKFCKSANYNCCA